MEKQTQTKPAPLVVERTYAASAARVWSALTDKAKMKQWYFDVDDFRPEVGFEFRFTGQNKGVVYHHICVVTEVIPEKKLVHTWAYDKFEGASTVTWELFAEGDEQTRVKLTHVGLETFPRQPILRERISRRDGVRSSERC